MILGIDPGTKTSGVVALDDGRVVFAESSMPNEEVLANLHIGTWSIERGLRGVVIEALSPRGQVVGWDVFYTIAWVGRMQEAAEQRFKREHVHLIHRNEVVMQLCGRGNVKGADKHLRQILLDTVGQKGTKAAPGPTYGVSGHAWQALAAVQAFIERRAQA